jgi:hypothetical protein
MRVEDPVNRRGGLKLGSALTLNQNLYFEMASNYKQKLLQNLIVPDIFSDPQDIGPKDHLWMDTTLKILP